MLKVYRKYRKKKIADGAKGWLIGEIEEFARILSVFKIFWFKNLIFTYFELVMLQSFLATFLFIIIIFCCSKKKKKMEILVQRNL